MATVVKDLGVVTAYAYAVAGGYTGTEEEFEELLGNIATDLAEIENLTVTITTLPAGSSATASYSNGVLALGVPKGDKGDPGTAATIAVGTVTTVAPTASAEVTNTGTTSAAVFTFKLPRGDGVATVSKTGTSGNVDTYTMTSDRGVTLGTFTVTNSNVSSVNGETGAVVLDAGDIGFDDSETYSAGTVGAELCTVKSAVIDLEDAVNDSTTGLNTKAPVIISNASGAIASFADGADSMPMKVVANIEPVQDLHGQDAPYPPGGGKNKLNATGNSEYTSLSDGVYTLTTVPSANVSFAVGNVDLKAGNAYILSGGSGSTNFRVSLTYDGTTYISGASESAVINVASDATVSVVAIITTSATSGSKIMPMVRLSSDPSGFAPYSNICPISGWTGLEGLRTSINLFDKTAVETSKYLDQVTGLPVSASNIYCVSDYILVKKGITVFIPATSTARRWYYNIKKEPVTYLNNQNGQAFTPPDDGYIRVSIKTDVVSIDTFYISFGTASTDYEQYQGKILSVNWQDTAGTVYGGNLTINRDGSVDLVKVYHRIEVTECTLVSVASSGVNYARISLVDYAVQENVSNKGWSSEYKFVSGVPTEGGRFRAFQSNVFIYDTRFTDKTVADGILASEKPQFVYKLATPVTYHLDSIDQITTLLGINNVWADTGDVVVDYPADTKLYIDGLTAPDEDMIADSNIDSGKYFVVGNNLYLSTAAILAGEQIIPGSNCTLTNLAEALNLINT